MITNSAVKRLNIFKSVLIVFFALSISACKKEETVIALPGPDLDFYALSDNNLIKFNAKSVKTAVSKVAITGLNSEKLLAIDFRPTTGELYGVSNGSKLYVININTGAARAISTTAFTPAISGSAHLQFNPATDKIKVISSTNQDLTIDPETATVTNTVVATSTTVIAYNNNYAGATSTTLYSIDANAKKLFKQESANGYQLQEAGNVDYDLSGDISFDISPDSKSALIVGTTSEGLRLLTADFTTSNEIKAAGKFGNMNIQSIAIATNPVAYAVDIDGKFLIFNPNKPDAPISKTITGLQNSETIIGMDIKPASGQLYAIGNTNRLYSVNMSTGAFTQIGTTFTQPLSGTSFGVDISPITNLITVVSNTGQNLSIDPANGNITQNPNIVTTTASLTATAYINNFVNATSTALYAIDSNEDKLYTLVENTGVLTEVGKLTIDVDAANGFDVANTNTAYAILTVGNISKIYSINLTNGTATSYQDFSKKITAFTLGLRI